MSKKDVVKRVNANSLVSNLMGSFKKALPKHIDPIKFGRVILTEFRRNPKLLECSQASIMGALMSCSETGLMPGIIGDSCLIPYYNSESKSLECQFQIMFKGYLKLARNTEDLKLSVEVVYSNDVFEYIKGTEETLKHIPKLTDKGDRIAVYAIGKTGNTQTIVILNKDDIEKVRGVAKTKKIWDLWTDEMWKKTAIKRLIKLMDLSTEQRQKLSLDEKTVHGMDVYGADITDWDTSTYADKEPPELKKKESKKETKKEDPEPEKENKDYRKLIFEGLNEMFEGNQNMADKKLIQLSTYEFTDKKTDEVIQVKGKWDIEKLSAGEAQVVWHKLEKELKTYNEPIDFGSEK